MGFPEMSARLSEKTYGKTQTDFTWEIPLHPVGTRVKAEGAGEDAGNANITAGVRAPTWQCRSRPILGKGLKKLRTDKSEWSVEAFKLLSDDFPF